MPNAASIQDEPFSETRERLQKRMGMSEKEFQRCKFSLLVPSTYKQTAPINDGTCFFFSSAALPMLIFCCRGCHSRAQMA